MASAQSRSRATHHRRFRDRRVGNQRALNLSRAETVAGNVEHIVKTADDPEVAILVAARAVASGVDAGIVRPVGRFVAFLVTVD